MAISASHKATTALSPRRTAFSRSPFTSSIRSAAIRSAVQSGTSALRFIDQTAYHETELAARIQSFRGRLKGVLSAASIVRCPLSIVGLASARPIVQTTTIAAGIMPRHRLSRRERESLMEHLLPLAARIAGRLVARRETIAVAESSTGGVISASLLAVPGASAYFLGGAVVYTAAARGALLAIEAHDMEGLRPASEAYAILLARRVRERLGATWGLAETGATGPTGNRYGDPAGHTCIAVAGPAERAFTLRTGTTGRPTCMPSRRARWKSSQKRLRHRRLCTRRAKRLHSLAILVFCETNPICRLLETNPISSAPSLRGLTRQSAYSRSPDGAKRNAGFIASRPRIALRSMRATISCRISTNATRSAAERPHPPSPEGRRRRPPPSRGQALPTRGRCGARRTANATVLASSV